VRCEKDVRVKRATPELEGPREREGESTGGQSAAQAPRSSHRAPRGEGGLRATAQAGAAYVVN